MSHSPARAATSAVAVSIAALGLAALFGGCGSDDPPDAGPSASAVAPAPTRVPELPTGTAPADSVSFRPVLVAPTDAAALPTLDQLGPPALDGLGIVGATARTDQTTGDGVVLPLLSTGPDGVVAFNALAAACAGRTSTCPTGQVAIVVDGAVVAAPIVQGTTFGPDELVISGNWSLDQAIDVARSIAAAAHG